MSALLRVLAPHHERLETLSILALTILTSAVILFQIPFGPLTSFALGMVFLLGGIGWISQLAARLHLLGGRLVTPIALLSRSATRMYGRLRLP